MSTRGNILIIFVVMCVALVWFLLSGCSKPIDKSKLPVLGKEDPKAKEIDVVGNVTYGLSIERGTFVKAYLPGFDSCEDKPDGKLWHCKARLGMKTGFSVGKEYWDNLEEIRNSGEPFMVYGYVWYYPAPVIYVTQVPPPHMRK